VIQISQYDQKLTSGWFHHAAPHIYHYSFKLSNDMGRKALPVYLIFLFFFRKDLQTRWWVL